MQENKMSMVGYIAIFIIVVSVLVYITLNKKRSSPDSPIPIDQVSKEASNLQGVKFTILKEGTGNGVQNGDVVSVNYTGQLSDGTVFDSSTDPSFGHVQPYIFSVGAQQVIKGWDEGIVGMKTGEQRKLEISPDFAYGAEGYPPAAPLEQQVIPSNATLTFTVDLLEIKK